jgi:hypothetical protein
MKAAEKKTQSFKYAKAGPNFTDFYYSGGYLDRQHTEKTVENMLTSSSWDNLSEFAVLILSRSQSKRGNLDLARDILLSFLQAHPFAPAIAVELSKVEGVIEKQNQFFQFEDHPAPRKI